MKQEKEEMKDEKCFDELWNEKGETSPKWYLNGYCKGYSCPQYESCKGNAEFDKLPKYPLDSWKVRPQI